MSFPINGTDPPLRLLAAFYHEYPSGTPEWILQAPGRDMWAAANATHGDEFSIAAADLESRTTFNRRTAKTRRTVMNRPLPRWARYPAGILLALQDMGLDIPGMEAVLIGEEPPGPRYDYALGIAFAALCHALCHASYTTASLIEIVDRVRRDYVEAAT